MAKIFPAETCHQVAEIRRCLDNFVGLQSWEGTSLDIMKAIVKYYDKPESLEPIYGGKRAEWNKVSLMTMMSHSQQHFRRLGEAVTLSCQFHAMYFDMFKNPVIWKKAQHQELTQINIQGTINAPFVQTKRFSVKFTNNHPVYKFELGIVDLSRADNGNYTCEVRGASSRVLTNVTHEVIVQAPVDQVYITNSNMTNVPMPSKLLYTEHKPGSLRCISKGGYPPPDLQVSVGDEDIGEMLSWTYIPNFEGPVGLKSISYTVERWSYSFLAKPAWDGADVLCAAMVPGLTAQATAVEIQVNYLPKVQCDTASAQVGQRNVSLTCIVSARPRPTSVRWTAEDNGTAFDVMASTAFWSTIRILNETSIKATLHISTAGPRRFRVYNVLAKNDVGHSMGHVQLQKAAPPVFTTTEKSASNLTLYRTPSVDAGSHYIFIISRGARSTFHACNLVLSTLIAYTGSSLLYR